MTSFSFDATMESSIPFPFFYYEKIASLWGHYKVSSHLGVFEMTSFVLAWKYVNLWLHFIVSGHLEVLEISSVNKSVFSIPEEDFSNEFERYYSLS